MAQITQAYGVILPITHGPSGYFAQSYTIADQIKSNLNLLMRTKKGERRMNPEFGSGMWAILFENYSDDLKQIIDSTLRKDIARWMNYVAIKSIDIQGDSKNLNQLNISLVYTIPSAGINLDQILNTQMNIAA